MKSLTVYKASAGSGKTFTLAIEFIKLLILRPERYENILAVTFTNKATEEMKHRIVSKLYGLANGLEDSNDYMQKITADLHMKPDVVKTQAAKALHNLLHHYNQFRVQTIDAFFQSILRNMAKELGLGSNLRVALNDDQIISQAVDEILDSINSNPTMMQWIMEYIGESMDDNKGWDITGDIKKFGKNLSTDFYKENEHLLDRINADDEFFRKYKAMLMQEANKILSQCKDISDAFFKMLEQEGFSGDDLSQKDKGVKGYFTKMGNGNIDDKNFNSYVRKAMENEDAWGAGKLKAKIAPVAKELLMPYLDKTETTRKKLLYRQNSINRTLEHLNKMRLLTSIRQEVDRLNRDNSRFLLSNTQTTLNRLIEGGSSDAPFIFEKIGAYLKHIMIDEFQDTSTIQWKNFKVLLDECLSIAEQDGTNTINNLIVGDVKQSIYRFRSGDWRLLNNITQEFNDDQIDIEPLSTNWRSLRNIINFNNKFFSTAARIVADEIFPEDDNLRGNIISSNNLSSEIVRQLEDYSAALRTAYDDVEQKVPENKGDDGLVRMEFLPSKNKAEFTDVSLERTLDYTKSLINLGARQKDITILVRNNSEVSTIANYFAVNAPEIKIVSDLAFILKASPLVLIIMSAMKWLADEKDTEARITLLKLYTTFVVRKDLNDNNLLTDENAFSTYIPEVLINPASRIQMLSQSVYELAESIYRILHLDCIQGQEAYVCAFFDGMKKFMEDNSASIDDFIAYWDSEFCSSAITATGSDCIRLMTIHKSKGLEFKHLIIPFCNWTVSGNKSTLWCTIHDEPFNKLPFIPVTYSGKDTLSHSIFDTFGNEEWIQELVDNLNLLYVAFTRAGHSLYVLTDQNEKDNKRTNLLLKTISALQNDLPGVNISGLDEFKNKEKGSEPQPVILSYGQHYLPNPKLDKKVSTSKRQNIFEVEGEPVTVAVKSYDNSSIMFRQSNKSRDFADDRLDDEDENRYTTMGSIMHRLFSMISSKNDIEKVLRQFEFDGVIYDEEISQEELRENLLKKFNNPQISDWFSEHWTVFNECNIMKIEEGRIKEVRPDRVITDGERTIVIDYKFGKRDKAYHNQVRKYMSLIVGMGYTNVEGYIWYVNEDDGVERVSLS